ncbi:MAG: hypothetical protein A2061_03650 [Gallionellales bacterium GWA2_59_43]|nr:MAG: hypothetical protein A2061_03650 [Gallionellales bacterium GWA2_59_43]
MAHAKFFSILVSVAVLAYGAIGFYFLPWAHFQGDLTRMAQLPETLFGWRQPQPSLAPELFQQASWQQADILVIGDSFSAPRVWQSVLAQRGFKVRTELWGSVQGICEDFVPWLRKQGYAGKYVVFERVEHSLAGDIPKSLACRHMLTHGSAPDGPVAPPVASFDPNEKNYTGRLSVGIRTWLNVLKYEHDFSDPALISWSLSNGVKMSRLEQGCSLFSHQRCKDVPFLGEDRTDDLGDETLKGMAGLNARLAGITPIWVIVPNKSTAYLYPEKHFWDKAERQLGAPNILREVRQAIVQKTMDLYPGNNTHFSTTGYLLLGNAVHRHLLALESQSSSSPPRSH